ncbi:MAG: hypothetical protein IJU62_07165 [Muribaculaceae bacterium]|nr:hypothetical protein [Muribaculaceae bacterium]
MKKLLLIMVAMSVAMLARGQDAVTRYRYWIDNNKQEGAVTGDTNGLLSLDIDIDALTTGVHLLTVMAADNNGNWSAPARRMFVKPVVPASFESGNIARYRYWIDNNKQEGAVTGDTNGLLSLDIDIDALTTGVHLLTVMAADNNGNWTPAARRMFVKPVEAEQFAEHHIAQCTYWFDNDRSTAVTAEVAGNLLDIDIDVESLSSGVHMLDIMVADETGAWSFTAKRHFVLIRPEEIVPEPDRHIVAYDYWFNYGVHRRVTLDAPVTTLSLIDVELPATEVLPKTLAGYVFDIEILTASVAGAEVTFGAEAVDDTGMRSDARTITFNSDLTIDPHMVLLMHKQPYSSDVPGRGDMRGFMIDEVSPNANMTFSVTAEGAKVDIYDADGNKLRVSVEAGEDGSVIHRVRPTVGGKVYALVYDVTEPVAALDVMWRVVSFCDLNDDGRVDVGDVNTVLNDILNGATNMNFDANGDGRVDVGDVNTILSTILNQ